MKYKHTIIHQTETSISIEMPLNSQMKIFDGHFENTPIMPAVTQLYFVEYFARKYLMLKGQFVSMRQLKFVDAICPETSIQISIEHHINNGDLSKQHLIYKYHEGETLKSKGRLHYHE